MSTSNRICPEHGDVVAPPNFNNYPQCGAQLVMKSTIRTAGEAVVHSTAIGLGVDLGLEAAEHVGDVIGNLFSN